MKKILLAIGGFLIVLAGGYGLGGGVGHEKVSYDIFGTGSTSSTLTATFAGNQKVIVSDRMENVHLDIRYIPREWDSLVFLNIEGSNDGGVNYYPVSYELAGSASSSLSNQGASSTVGIPYTFPTDASGASGTLHTFMVDLDIVADHIRFSVKESSTSTQYGDIKVRATLTNKQ